MVVVFWFGCCGGGGRRPPLQGRTVSNPIEQNHRPASGRGHDFVNHDFETCFMVCGLIVAGGAGTETRSTGNAA